MAYQSLSLKPQSRSCCTRGRTVRALIASTVSSGGGVELLPLVSTRIDAKTQTAIHCRTFNCGSRNALLASQHPGRPGGDVHTAIVDRLQIQRTPLKTPITRRSLLP